MAWRSGHGAGAGRPHIEVLPADELPAGLPALAGAHAGEPRGERGRFALGNKSSAAGGRARLGTAKLATRIGIGALADATAFAPYKRMALSFAKAHRGQLAANVGGGVCGTGPSSIVSSAALALAASRYLYDHANGDPAVLAQASRLANDSRQGLLAAYELAAKEAHARRAAAPEALPWFVADDADGGRA